MPARSGETAAPTPPHSAAEALMRENVESMRRVDETAQATRSRADRMASFIANFCGSLPFVWLHAAAFSLWLGFNSWPGIDHVDPYPFTLLTLIVSLEAIFLSSFILISQNHELRISDRRNQLDLQINLLTEQENTKMLQLLERIAKKVGVDTGNDHDIHILKETTDPEELIAQIDQAQQSEAAAQALNGQTTG